MIEFGSANTSRKLSDVTQPFRYQCPECDSHTINVRAKTSWETVYKEVTKKNKPGPDTAKDFLCESCGTPFDRPFDKKQGKRRRLEL